MPYLCSTAFAAGLTGAWRATAVLAVLGPWYLPFGTVASAAVLALLVMPSLRGRG